MFSSLHERVVFIEPLSRIFLSTGQAGLIASFLFLQIITACTPLTHLVMQGGEESERHEIRPHRQGPYVLIFAMDGAGYNQMTEALQTGVTPWLSELIGGDHGDGLFEHAYSVPNAISLLPSSTIPGWSAIFTGLCPADNGIPGDEWFVREKMRFLAPIPISVEETDDARKAISEDLIGKALHGPTLFERVDGPAFVSLNSVHRGADLFTTDDPTKIAALTVEFKAGKLVDSIPVLQESYEDLDRNSVPKVIDTIQRYGVPTVQVVYFPGIDLFTHLAANPLQDQVHYLENITFPLIETVLGEYRRQGALDETFVLFISDHGHTPVLMDKKHALATEPERRVLGLLRSLGFRVRPGHLEVSDDQSDYQAVLAYQDAMAYLYLADRSACLNPGQTCDWSKPPRFEQDVMPVVRALYRANRKNGQFPALKGTLDLVFARKPLPIGQDSHEYEIYDGTRLVPINDYLKQNPRPDLIQLDRRMRWLSKGPYGHLAGDVLLLAKSGFQRPIDDRFYFSASYHSQHGSASAQDSHIVLMLARQNRSGEMLHKTVSEVVGNAPSQLDMVPLILRLLKSAH